MNVLECLCRCAMNVLGCSRRCTVNVLECSRRCTVNECSLEHQPNQIGLPSRAVFRFNISEQADLNR